MVLYQVWYLYLLKYASIYQSSACIVAKLKLEHVLSGSGNLGYLGCVLPGSNRSHSFYKLSRSDLDSVLDYMH